MQYPAIILFVFLILIVGSASAYELGMSPPRIALEGAVGMPLCTTVAVFSKDYRGLIVLSDHWSRTGGNNGAAYALSADEVGIASEYSSSFFLNGSQEEIVCFTALRDGAAMGLLLATTSAGNVEVGAWITVTAHAKGTPLTGASVTEVGDVGTTFLLANLALTLFLAIFLYWLMRRAY